MGYLPGTTWKMISATGRTLCDLGELVGADGGQLRHHAHGRVVLAHWQAYIETSTSMMKFEAIKHFNSKLDGTSKLSQSQNIFLQILVKFQINNLAISIRAGDGIRCPPPPPVKLG
jgi:hypothetical protein